MPGYEWELTFVDNSKFRIAAKDESIIEVIQLYYKYEGHSKAVIGIKRLHPIDIIQ